MQDVKGLRPTNGISNLVLRVFLSSSRFDSVKGWIDCTELPRSVPFYGLGDLLIEIDRVCDYVGFPQKWEQRRSLYRHAGNSTQLDRQRLLEEWQQKPCGYVECRSEETERRHILSIQIMARQHASCQGRLILPGNAVFFRSELELLGLLRELLNEKKLKEKALG